MRREERRNLRRTRKNHRHTLFLPSFSPCFFLFFFSSADTVPKLRTREDERTWFLLCFLFFFLTFSITSCFDVFSRSEYLSLDFSPYLFTLPYILARTLPFSSPLSLFSHKLKLYTIKYLAYITVFRITNPMYIYLFDFVSSSFPSHNHKSRGKKKTTKVTSQSRGRATISLLFGNFSPARCLFRLSWKKKQSASNSYYTPCLVQTCRQVPFSRYSDFLISSYSNELMRVTINTNLSFTVNYRICNHITSRLLRYIV